LAVVDIVEFELGKVQAASHWREKGEVEVADAFLRMELDLCNIGLDKHGRLAWARIGWVVVGLRFDLESGDYNTSFFHRLKRPEPGQNPEQLRKADPPDEDAP
jgi:hypothetical protein